jgi:hypothetical protein
MRLLLALANGGFSPLHFLHTTHRTDSAEFGIPRHRGNSYANLSRDFFSVRGIRRIELVDIEKYYLIQ